MQHKTSRYFDLSIPAPVRLSLMKSAFETHAQDYPHCPESARPKSWRDVRGTTHANVRAYTADLDQGFNGEGYGKVPVWYCHTGPQFRGEKFVHECENFHGNHTGWYTNHEGWHSRDGTGLARGIVGHLTHGRLIAGYWWGDNGERVYFPEVYSDMADAVKAADEHARVFAESAQEDSRKQDELREAEEKVAETLNEKVELVARMKEAAALRHDERFPYMRKRYSELCVEYRNKCKEHRKAQEALDNLED